MDVPLYILIPFAVAFLHYDNYPRAWRWAWAKVRRWFREMEPEAPLPPRGPRPNIFPQPQKPSDMLLSEMRCIVTGEEMKIGNPPKDVVVIQVKNATAEKLARVRNAFKRLQDDQ